MQLEKLIEFIKDGYPKSALDIKESLALLCETIDGLMYEMENSMSHAMKSREFDTITQLANQSKDIDALQKTIEGYIDQLELEEGVAENIIDEEDTKEEENARIVPDYTKYVVDSNISYNLYENFTHKCPAAFSIEGAKIEAKKWKEVLVLTCEILAKKDRMKFHGFVNDPSIQGKKAKYIADRVGDMRKPVKLRNEDIYIETNMSANQTRNVLIKLLKKYDIKVGDFKIYLRADYTDLH